MDNDQPTPPAPDRLTQFNSLFKKTRTGAIEQWDIHVVAEPGVGVIVVTHGQVNGKKQVGRDVVSKGKSTGKKNETTAYGQALLEALAKWEKQKKKGYVESIDDAASGRVDESVIKGGIDPMLAAKFAEDGDLIVWPAYVQPKLDGHRCIAIIVDGKATLWSRTRKPVLSVPHIVEMLEKAFVGQTLTLDGELYDHDLRDNFQKLSGLLRRNEPTPETLIAQYHVYDLPSSAELGFGDRHEILRTHFFNAIREPEVVAYIRLVETIKVADEDGAMLAFEHFLSLGYEGAMLRNLLGAYLFSRSSGDRSENLQKLKKFDDAEFRIVNIEEGRGKLAGHAIFVCRRFWVPKTDKEAQEFGGHAGQQTAVDFNAKMKGPQSELAVYFQNPKKYIGLDATVKYQGFYKSGKPRFPVAWRLKEDL